MIKNIWELEELAAVVIKKKKVAFKKNQMQRNGRMTL